MPVTTLPARQVLDSLFQPYERRLDGTAGDSREYIAMADLAFRVAYTLLAAGARSGGDTSLRVAASPGMGTMLSLIRVAVRTPPTSDSIVGPHLQQLAQEVCRAVDAFSVPTVFASFKELRDRLSHGHALAADHEVAERVRTALSRLASRLRAGADTVLAGATLNMGPNSTTLHLPVGKEAGLDLWPLWGPGRIAGDVGIYSHSDAEGVHLLVPGRDIATVTDEATLLRFHTGLLSKKSEDRSFARFVNDVVRDIGTFTEGYSPPSYHIGDEESQGTVVVPWSRATSEGTTERTDRFRVGPNHERQWSAAPSADWKPYSWFLREIANTPVIAKRIGYGLEALIKQKAEEELLRLGFAPDDGPPVPQRLLCVDQALDITTPGGKPFVLEEAVDREVEALRPTTKVFFIVGQAGLGKTRLLLNAALARARAVEADPTQELPLYLFVSSSGRALSSLEDAVNSALNVTRLLSSHSAKTLCRNGQLVLLVDGFDELLGVAGYENALGSLEPWFRDLGGRGVLVASARSSYYLTQYRRSLSEAVGIAVDHTLAAIQPWQNEESRRYLTARGLTDAVLSRLSLRDWDLLGVPFLAKALVAWHRDRAGVDPKGDSSIFDIVVDRFLRREAGKLVDPSRGELMTAGELRTCFTVLAEQMQREDTRELDMSWLEMATEYAIGASPDSRPGLRRRLTSLCALGATVDEADGNRFQFSHEIMFDCFLSLALEEVVSRQDAAGARLLLEKGKIHAAALGWLSTRSPQSVRAAVGAMMRASPDAFPPNLRENLGALWVSWVDSSGGVPPSTQVRGVRVASLALAPSGWSDLSVEHCQFEKIVLQAGTVGKLAFVRSEVGILVAPGKALMRQVVRSARETRFRSLQLGQDFADAPGSVRLLLAQLALVEKSATEPSPMEEAASFFLERMTLRSEVPVVTLDSSKLADDDRLKWTLRLGADTWQRFVTLLLRSRLAEWERITASGAPKSRLAFNISPAGILRRDTDPRIARFWEEAGDA